MSNMKSTKKVSEVQPYFPAGFPIEIELKDNSVHKIKIGNIEIGSTYGIQVYIPAAPQTETKYKLSGTILDAVIVDQFFDDKYAAQSMLSALNQDVIEPKLVITKVEVPVED